MKIGILLSKRNIQILVALEFLFFFFSLQVGAFCMSLEGPFDVFTKNMADTEYSDTISIPTENSPPQINLENVEENWMALGQPGFTDGSTRYNTMATSPDGKVYVAFQDNTQSGKVSVWQYFDNSWSVVDKPGISLGKATNISIAVDNNGIPYIAYDNGSSNGQLTVQRYFEENWEIVGSANISPGNVGFSGNLGSFDLALNENGLPYVAYKDNANIKKITVQRFNGVDWEIVGLPGFSDGEVKTISLAIGNDNKPYVAYSDQYHGGKATIQVYNETNWEVVGTRGFTSEVTSLTTIAIDSQNKPYIALRDHSNNYRTNVYYYDGTDWIIVGTPGFSLSGVDEISFALNHDDVPFIAYRETNGLSVTIRRFMGDKWETVGYSHITPGGSSDPFLALDNNGTPYLSYRDAIYNGKASVKKVNTFIPYFFGILEDSVSTEKHFQIHGKNLTDSIHIQAPNGFKVSLSSEGDFTDEIHFFPSSINIDTTVYVVFSPDSIGWYKEKIQIRSKNAIDQIISLSGFAITKPQLAIDNITNITPVSAQIKGKTLSTGGSTIIERGFVYNTTGTPSLSDQVVTIDTAGQFSATLPDLIPGTQYFVRTYARNQAGLSYSEDYSFFTPITSIQVPEFEDDWEVVGIPGISMGQAAYVTMDTDKNGISYVAYSDYGNGGRASVKRYIDGAWETVGSEGISAGSAGHTSLALDGNDVPYIAYREGAAGYQIVVKKFNGTTWEAVGVVDPSAKNASTVKIAINQNNQPYVVYNDGGYSNEATVRRFNGTFWEIVGTRGFSAGDVDYVDIAFSVLGIPYVAYRDQGNAYKATVQFLNGSQWEVVGSPGFSAEKVEFVDIAISAQNNIYIAYVDIGNGSRASVQKYVDGNWQYVGTPGFSEGVVDYTSLALDRNGYPYVAYKDAAHTRKATVQKFNGSHWESVGGPGFTPDDVDYTFIDRDASDHLYLAFRDRSTGGKVSVHKLANHTLNFDSTAVETISAVQKFTVIGNNIIDSITLVAPAGFELSTDSIAGYSDTLIIHPVTNPVQQTVFARFSPDSLKTYEGKITITTSLANPQMISARGTAILPLPAVTTVAINSPTATSAKAQGEVMINALDSITEKGFVYAQHPNPDLSDHKITSEDEGESFSRIIENLQPGTTYYARAFATNATGTGFGEVVQFITLKAQPTIQWIISGPIVYGDVLNDELSATASWEGNTLSGTFTYYLDSASQQPAEGAFLHVGYDQSLFVHFVPEASTAYLSATYRTIIDVLKKTITVTVQDTSKVYGEENPEFTMRYEGFVNGEDESVFAKIPTITTEADKASSAGSYPITVSGGSDSQYSFEYVFGTLTIHKAIQTITFAALPDITTATTEVKLSASASSNLPVSYHVEGPATLEDTVLKITGGGTIMVTASQPGNDNYQAAEDVIQSFTVVEEDKPETPKAPQTITFADLPDITTATTEVKLSASASSRLPITYQVEGPATLEDTVLKIIGEGTVKVTASQPGNDNYQAAEDVIQSFTVVEEDKPETPKTPQTITFADLPDITTSTTEIKLSASASSNLPVSYHVEGPATLEDTVLKITGEGAITVTASQPGNENYQAAEDVIQSFIVVEEDLPETPKTPQTITIEAPETITLEEPLELKGESSSGLPVSYVIEGPAIIEGNLLIPTDTGTITLTIIQSGNESYDPAQNLVIKIRIEELMVTGTEDDWVSNTINVFPNPSAGKLCITFEDHSWQGGNIIITDLLGNIIITKSVTGDIEIFDIKEKNIGIYFLMIQKGERQKTFKLLKI